MEKHIYIFKSETGECKIGVSNNVTKRKSTIEMQGNNNIVDFDSLKDIYKNNQ